MGKASMSAVRGAATREALQPFNGLRVLAAVHIMVRTITATGPTNCFLVNAVDVSDVS